MDTSISSNPVVQNPDRNVFPTEYETTSIRVREIFATLQGEMPYAGRAAIFLRLGGCNRGAKIDRGCASCDTSFEFDKSLEYNPQELLIQLSSKKEEFFKNFMPAIKPLLVITGGEPFLQNRGLNHLFQQIGRQLFEMFEIQFETNGDFEPMFMQRLNDLAFDTKSVWTIVVSPKGSQVNASRWFLKNRPIYGRIYIRRIVSCDPTSVYHKIPESYEQAYAAHNVYDIFVSPQTEYQSVNGVVSIDPIASKEHQQYAIDLCLTKGYSLSLQTHLTLGLE